MNRIRNTKRKTSHSSPVNLVNPVYSFLEAKIMSFQYRLFLAILALALTTAMLPNGAVAANIRIPTDHPTIQAAIDACADGDVIRIGPGTYAESLSITTRTLTLAAETSNTVTIRPSAGPAIAADGPGTLILSGLRLEGVRPDSETGAHALQATQKQIFATGCKFTGDFNQGAGVSVEDSPMVSLSDCILLGGNGDTSSSAPYYGNSREHGGGHALIAVRCNTVRISGGKMTGGIGGLREGRGASGGYGAYLDTNGNIVVIDVKVYAGKGGTAYPPVVVDYSGGSGGYGIKFASCPMTRLQDSAITGGNGGSVLKVVDGVWASPGPGQPGVYAIQGSHISARNVKVMQGKDSNGSYSMEPVVMDSTCSYVVETVRETGIMLNKSEVKSPNNLHLAKQ